MSKYLIDFIVTLVAAGFVMMIVNSTITDDKRRRRHWGLAVGLAVGMTMGQIVTDCFHPSYGRIVRALITGAAVALVPLLIERLWHGKSSSLDS